MGFLSSITPGQGNLFGGLGGGLISSAFGLYAQNEAEKNQGHYLQKQQDFNAEQAAIQRDWSAGQAGIHRDWSAAEAHKSRQFSKNAYKRNIQWRVADMKKAGINPILAVGGGYGGNVSSAASASSSPASGGAATSSLTSDNSINSGLTAMQSYSTMFKTMTSAIADIIKASKDKQTINIKTPISDIADSFKGGVEGIWNKWSDKGSLLGDKLNKAVSSRIDSASAKSYKGSNERLVTVYKSMQRLKGLPKSSYTSSNYRKIANTILRDRSLQDGQKGILLKRLRTIWSTGK